MRASDVNAAYAGASGAWASGPAARYDAMAQPLVDHCPVPLAGARVLDFGAGTGGQPSAAVLDAGSRSLRLTRRYTSDIYMS
jgi:hypothetical protein